MKFSFLLILGLVYSCGKVEIPKDRKLSTYNSIEPELMPVGSTEYNRLKEICDAVQRKTETIASLVNTNYVFSGTAKDCKATSFTPIADSSVSLLNVNGSYKFGQLSSLFYFDEVETINEGVISQLCSKLSALSSPITVNETNLLYFTTQNISGVDCASTSFERCIKIEKATKETKEGELQGRVHTREWIRVKLDDPGKGFFTYKKRISEASCEEGFFLGRTANLK